MGKTIIDYRNSNYVQSDAGSEICNYATVLTTTDSGGSHTISEIGTFPIVENTEYDNSESENTITSESNIVYKLSGGEKNTSIKMSFMQQDYDTMKMHEDLADKTLCIVKEMRSKPIDNKLIVYIQPISKLSKSFSLSAPGASIQHTFNGYPTTYLMTIDLACFVDGMAGALVTNSLEVAIPVGTTSMIYSADLQTNGD